jgi:hypothetical protein
MKRANVVGVIAAVVAVVAAPASAAPGASRIEGRWKTPRRTLHELLAVGTPRASAVQLARYPRNPGIDLHHGVYEGLDLDTGRVISVGTYRLTGNVVHFVFSRKSIAVKPGQPYALRWSIFRDRLTFSYLPGRQDLGWFVVHPFTRVG